MQVLNGKHYHCTACCVKISMLETLTHLGHSAGKMNAYGWLRYSGFARHKDPMLDAAGALADLLVFSLNLTGLDILQKIENQDNTW